MEDKQEVDIHHRICKSWTKDRMGGAKIELKKKYHIFWHTMFDNLNIFIIANIINFVFGDSRYKLVVEVRHETKTDRQRDWRENKRYYKRYLSRQAYEDFERESPTKKRHGHA